MLMEMHIGTMIFEKPSSENIKPIFDITDAILWILVIVLVFANFSLKAKLKKLLIHSIYKLFAQNIRVDIKDRKTY